jgi:hypothetical protein
MWLNTCNFREYYQEAQYSNVVFVLLILGVADFCMYICPVGQKSHHYTLECTLHREYECSPSTHQQIKFFHHRSADYSQPLSDSFGNFLRSICLYLPLCPALIAHIVLIKHGVKNSHFLSVEGYTVTCSHLPIKVTLTFQLLEKD